MAERAGRQCSCGAEMIVDVVTREDYCVFCIRERDEAWHAVQTVNDFLLFLMRAREEDW